MVCVIFIFVYAFGYSLGFGPAAWLYGSEVNNVLQKTYRSPSIHIPSLIQMSDPHDA